MFIGIDTKKSTHTCTQRTQLNKFIMNLYLVYMPSVPSDLFSVHMSTTTKTTTTTVEIIVDFLASKTAIQDILVGNYFAEITLMIIQN